MGIQFLLGRAGTGKSGHMLDELRQKLLADPQGPAIFYIVPDQMTFQQEYKLFNSELQGSIRAQVASFSRLAWRVLQETGGGTRQFISSIGIQMMLRKIIEEKGSDWHVFQKAIEKQGFLTDLENMITEFKRYQVTPELLKLKMEEINTFVHKDPNEVGLTNKLSDLTYIYEKLVIALQDKYIDAEDQLQLLADKIPKSPILENAEIYFDGFHRFTPQELQVIEALMKRCKKITIALTTDEESIQSVSELDLFYQTSETYHSLKEMAKAHNIPVEHPIVMSQINGRFKDRPYFYHLENHFDSRPVPAYKEKAPIQIAEAVHPRAEVEGVAQEIIRLVREENYRFRDMAIFIRETDMYHDLIGTIFSDYDIPVFIDEKRTMLNHSLIEFIRSLFDVVESNWRYEAVFRVLKTGFIPVSDETYPLTNDGIDELENYVLEYGMRSRERWFGTENWKFQRFQGFDDAVQTDREKEIELRINSYRRQVVHALETFDQTIRQAQSVSEKCMVIYTLLEELQVPERLEQLRTTYDDAGLLEKGREQEQVWDAVVQLLDEMVEIAGAEKMTITTFRSVIEAGFESLSFSHVPPSIDHVIVGTIDRSRMTGVKCAFLLGVNDGAWPMRPPIDGMINELERNILAEHGLQLAESNRRKLLDDWFYMYIAFTAAKDRLWVSYLLSDEEGKTKMPSQLIKRLQDFFPESSQPILLQDPDDLYEATRFITTPSKTRSALTAQLSRNHRGYPMDSIWLNVLHWYIENEQKYSPTYNVLQSLYYQNSPQDLTQATVEQLYPQQVKTSVSRLEMYHRCSFQHYAQYNLGLEERRTFTLDAPDIGQLFHEALKTITEWIQKEGHDFAQLTKQQTEGYARKVMNHLAPVLQHQILYSSNRYKYIQQKLQSVIARATFILSEQARQSGFSPVGIELGFGENQKLAPLTIQLPNGYEIKLRGRIDRVDKAYFDGNLFLRIIDYKSSATGLSLLDIYYGLSLQMLTYLDVVLTQSEQWLGQKAYPAGVLYFHVHNAILSEHEKLDEDLIAEEIFKQYKMQGLLLSNEELVKMMDTSLTTGSSQIVPAGLKKNGGFYKYSKVAGDETFAQLQAHIRHLMVQAGLEMTAGNLQLNPYEHKQETACRFCSFRSVCQFDTTLDDNNYRKLPNVKEETLLTNIQKGGTSNGKLD